MGGADEIIEDLRNDIANGRVIVLAGAGLSKNVTGGKSPNWREFLETGWQHLRGLGVLEENPMWRDWLRGCLDTPHADPLLAAATAIGQRLRGESELAIWLRKQFETLQITNSQPLRALAAWKCPLMTTNYDMLLEKGTNREGFTWQNGRELSRFTRKENNGVLHLHGCWNDPESVVLVVRDLMAVSQYRPIQAYLQANALGKSLVIIGCGDGMTDPNIGTFLKWLRNFEHEVGVECRHYRLYCEKEPNPGRDGRVFPVPYGNDFDDLGKFLERLVPPGETIAAEASRTYSPPEKQPRATWPESVIRYVTELADQTAMLNLIGFGHGMQIDLPIKRAWVPLRVLQAYTADPKAFERGSHDVNAVFLPKSDTHRGALLLGEPGGGKTTAARQLAWCLASASVDPETLGLDANICPVYLRFRDLSEEAAGEHGGLEQFLQKSLYRSNSPPGYRNAGDDLLKDESIPILWILDGLDEIVDPSVRNRMSESVSQTLKNRKKDRFLVTCRHAGYDRARSSLREGFHEYHVQQLGEEDRKSFVKEWFRMVYEKVGKNEKEAAEKAERLLEKLAGRQYQTQKMRELTGNPMLLTVLCLVFEDNEDLPRQRGAVYERCVDVLLVHWSKAKYRSSTFPNARQPLEPTAVREVLIQLAWWLHRRENRTAESLKLLGMQVEGLVQAMREEDRQGLTATEFLDRVRQETGILKRETGEAFGFLHLTFQEFLAAKAAIARREADFLGRQVATSDWWLEASLLSLQADRDYCKEFFTSLLSVDSLDKRPKVLTECLSEAKFVEPEPFVAVVRNAHKNPGRAVLVLNSLQGRAQQMPTLADAAEKLMSKDSEWLQIVAREFLHRAGRPSSATRRSTDDKFVFDDRLQTTFVQIGAGSFKMGRRGAATDADDIQHPVKITKTFLLARTPVTNAQYELFLRDMGHPRPLHWNDRLFNEPMQPVVGVSWGDAAAYCLWATGRLPSEAEWEFACRAGRTDDFCFGDKDELLDQYGWFRDNSSGSTQAVGLKKPNEWGLCDMHGNVFEWCEDGYNERWYAESPLEDPVMRKEACSRVLRGGSWSNYSEHCFSWIRNHKPPGTANCYIGFRLVRDL
jgi:formylglycine-generating enzyme required for sulfatase activity